MSEYVARLENWCFAMLTKKEGLLWGDCYGDELGRFPDGARIHTSGVRAGQFKEGDVVQTRNNKYLLGKEWKNSNENHDSTS